MRTSKTHSGHRVGQDMAIEKDGNTAGVRRGHALLARQIRRARIAVASISVVPDS